ncbi:MAG TPA: ATP-dependent DNA helicase [Solimonas sp.]|nr:ATP-dependent DNA helicase [Solimonas sp.]
MSQAADLLGPDGPLARSIPGYLAREPQQRMADAVAAAFDEAQQLIVEAGTGTGKTFAYLVPALLSDRRVVISTGTRNLQDQLFHRDLPRVRDALQVPARVALLKGRANYLCLYRMKRARVVPGLNHLHARLREVEEWSRSTAAGEISELGVFADDDPLTRQITSTTDNCLGSKCADFDKCHVVKARRAAQGADVLVVNHHLLFADFVLKQEGFGQILAGTDAVVIDEAHQLPELASQFFGVRVSTRQLQDLARDTQAEAERLGDVPDLKVCATELAAETALLEACFQQAPARLPLAQFLARPEVAPALGRTRTALDNLFGMLKPFEERNAELAACVERAAELQARCATIADETGASFVRWTEGVGRGGALHATPIEVAAGFQKMLAQYPGAWVFTSATLAADDGFAHFAGQMGLADAQRLELESPFDFPEQARLYLPEGLPEPNDPRYSDAVADAALPVIKASGGGAFVLCTSHRALRQIAGRLRAALSLRVFVQGEDSRAALLEKFAAHGDAVLVGTASFWEGVDVKGRALRVVIIDRIPFTAPGDPVYEARLDSVRRAGGSPFNALQLPEAIVMLRQGVGRLIRDRTDRGLLMLCDPRLRTKSYGRKVLASLPQMPVLTQLVEAQRWLATL